MTWLTVRCMASLQRGRVERRERLVDELHQRHARAVRIQGFELLHVLQLLTRRTGELILHLAEQRFELIAAPRREADDGLSGEHEAAARTERAA